MAKKKGTVGDEKRTALGLGAAGLTFSGALGAARLLNKALMRSGGGKAVPATELFRLSDLMGFPEHGRLPVIKPPLPWESPHPRFEGIAGEKTIKIRGQKVKFPKGVITLPIHPTKGTVPLGASAHEMGHAKGGVIQRGAKAVKGALFMEPKAVTVPSPRGGLKGLIASLRRGRLPGMVPGAISTPRGLSPLHLPLLAAAVTPKADDKTLKWIQEHPAEIAATMAAVPIAQEVHASTRALKGIKKLPLSTGGGWAGVRREAVPLGKGLVSHALGYLPIIAALLVGSKVRDLIQGRKKEKMEKRAHGDGWASVEAPLFGFYSGGESMNLEEAFLNGFGSTLEKISEGDEEEEPKKEKKKEEPKKEKEKEKEKEEEQTKEGSGLEIMRERLGLSKTAASSGALSHFREKLGLTKAAGSEEEGGEPEGAFEAWKQTL